MPASLSSETAGGPLSTPGVLMPSDKPRTWKTSSSPWTSKWCLFLKPFLSVHRSLLLKSPFYYLAWFKKKDKSKFPPNYNSPEGCSKFPMSARNTNRPYNHWVIYDTVRKPTIGLHQWSLYCNSKCPDIIIPHVHGTLTMCQSQG